MSIITTNELSLDYRFLHDLCIYKIATDIACELIKRNDLCVLHCINTHRILFELYLSEEEFAERYNNISHEDFINVLHQMCSVSATKTSPLRTIDMVSSIVSSVNTDVSSRVYVPDRRFHRVKASKHANNKYMEINLYKSKMNKAIKYLESIKGADNIPSQAQRISPLLRIVNEIMSDLNTEKQHYLRCTLLLVKTMILDYSSEKVLEHGQIDALINVVKNCADNDISKDVFLTHHDYLEENGLDMFPTMED